MKAAVITLHSVSNYGTQLQAYATQEKLKEYFDDVVFIDYKRSDTYGKGLLKTFTKGNIFKAPAILQTLLYWKHNFGGFQKKYLNLTEEKYLSLEDFNNFKDIADIYFTGSDQVWNTGWNHGMIPPIYLSFLNDDKPRYSYSSSFGTSILEDKYVEISQSIENIEFKNAANKIMELLDYANKYYDESKPWVQIKENEEDFNNTIYTCSVIIANISNLIEAFMPETAQKIRNYLNIADKSWNYIEVEKGLKLENIQALFERMSNAGQ